MNKIQITDLDLEPTDSIEIDRSEIVVDDASDKIEIYHLDSAGQRIEGGTFDKNKFIDAVVEFYNANF